MRAMPPPSYHRTPDDPSISQRILLSWLLYYSCCGKLPQFWYVRGQILIPQDVKSSDLKGNKERRRTMDNIHLKTSMIWATIWIISTVAALGDALTASSSSRFSSTTNSSSSRIWSNSTSLPTSLTTTVQLPASSSNSLSRPPLDVHLDDVSAHIWSNSTSLPASLTSTVQLPTPSSNSSSRPSLGAHLEDVSVTNSPATLTNNPAGDVILTLSQDFANDIADRLSYGTCPAYDPKPSKPIIEKRQILARNPCAVTRSKSGIASIGGGTSLFRSLFNLPKAFPPLVSPLDIDAQDIASYVKLDLPSWSLVPGEVINATAELFYLMTLKHEMNIGGSITVNTILHYDIAQSGNPTSTTTSSFSSTTAVTSQTLTRTCPSNTFKRPSPTAAVRFLDIYISSTHRKADSYSQSPARPNYATPQQAQRRVELSVTLSRNVQTLRDPLLIDA